MTDASALHAQRWALGFAARGWQVQLLNWGGPATLPGIDIIPILDARPDRGTGPFATLAGFRHLRRELQRADLVHVHSIPAGRWVTCLAGLPRLMLTPWGSDTIPRAGKLTRPQQRWTRYALRQGHAIGGYSRFHLQALHRHYGIPTERLHWTPLGVDVTLFDPALHPLPAASPFVIGFFKHLRPIYGAQVLIEALARFRHQFPDPWEARLYGDGPLHAELAARIGELQLGDHVRLMGRVAHDQLPAAMAACHLVVSPSIVEESLGLASLEAQALGIPVLNSDLGGMPETCQRDISGLLLPPGEPAAWASQLLRLARAAELRRSMGSQGRQFIIDAGYEWETCLDRADLVQRRLLTLGR